MLRNTKIRTRLLVLIAVQVTVMSLIVAFGVFSLRQNQNDLATLGSEVKDQIAIRRLAEQVNEDLSGVISQLAVGSLGWEQGRDLLRAGRERFAGNWQRYLASLNLAEAEYVQDLHADSLASIDATFAQAIELAEGRNRSNFSLFIANDFTDQVQPYFDILAARSARDQVATERLTQEVRENGQLVYYAELLLGLFGILVSVLLGFLVYRSISRPIEQVSQVIARVSQGDYEARTNLTSADELGNLGQAFDQLLQERVSGLADLQQENEQLNNSIISLLQAVFQLSQRDLTVQVPVTEDVTGPVADALNLLTNETARVLQEVTSISDNVATASNLVKDKSDQAIQMADSERQEVEKTASELSDAARSMNHIAELAQACNLAADNAIKTTQIALETVTSTVAGINSTRDTIRETEKRIKRLGDRSQEINGVVNIINTIAERTHILALNASMHAASAGEAGRGFAVVANEVQRLAENAREATSQIATLVGNIQVETSETVATMNTAISQVVEGSRLAEQAGTQMQNTQSTTAELVAAVAQIADNSQQQARISNDLLVRANQIKLSSQETSRQLSEQSEQTTNLVDYARSLVESVGVFKLPSTAKAEAAPEEKDSAQAA